VNFSRPNPAPAFGNIPKVSPSGTFPNRDLNGAFKNIQTGGSPPSNSTPGTFPLKPLGPIDPSKFHLRPGIGSQFGGGSDGNQNSSPMLPSLPPGFTGRHLNPLPGEHGTPLKPPAPGIPGSTSDPTSPGNAGTGSPSSGLQDLGSLLNSAAGLLSGGSGGDSSSGAAGDAGGSQPVDAAPQPAAASRDDVQPVKKSSSDDAALDIALTDVRLVDAGSLERNVGPRYRLFIKNTGTIETPKFHVSVAVDAGNELTSAAELVTVEAVGMRPGKTQTVDVRLPVEVLKMSIDETGKAAPFKVFAAVVDSDGDLAEANADNNVWMSARDQIKPVEK
jgi:hypothetical protein